MNFRTHSLTLILLGIVCFLLAAASAWQLTSVSAPRIQETAQEIPRKITRPSLPVTAANQAAQKLESIRSTKNASTRVHATIALANSLSLTEIPTWLDRGYITLRDGPEAEIFRRILVERWRQLDPEGQLAWASKNEDSSSDNTLQVWAKDAPQRVLNSYQNHPDSAAELEALEEMAKHHPALVLQRLQEMAPDLSPDAMDESLDLFFQIAKQSPDTLTGSLANLPPALLKQAEIALSGIRLAKDFSAEIHDLFDQPDGWDTLEENFRNNHELRGKLFDELANLPPEWRAQLAQKSYYAISSENSQKWLNTDLAVLGFSSEQIKKLRGEAIEDLANSNPAAAFQMIEEVEGWSRKNLISNSLSRISSDPEKCAVLIAQLSSEADRSYANGIMNAKKLNFSDDQTPTEWLEKMTQLDTAAPTPSNLEYLLKSALPQQIKQLNTQFSQLPTAQKQHIAKALTHYDFVPSRTGTVFHGEVLRYALTQPADPELAKKLLRSSSAYAVNLSTQDPAAASEWVHSLPESDAKLQAQKNLAANWHQYDPAATEQWIKALPVSTREKIEKHLKHGR